MKGLMSVCRLAAVLAILVGVAGSAVAQGRGGIIEGRVLDARSGDPLPGATVLVEDSAVSTATDNTGAFRLTGVPPGMHTVLITYLGPQGSGDLGHRLCGRRGATGGQARADRVRGTGDGIGGIHPRRAGARAEPAEDRAEHHQRRVGGSDRQLSRIPTPPRRRSAFPASRFQRDQGEGRYVHRPRHRAAAQLDDDRRRAHSVARSADFARSRSTSIPSDLLQAIEVSKALTPDMDADSIGGSVNLVMKQAPETLPAVRRHRRRLQRAARQLRAEQRSL